MKAKQKVEVITLMYNILCDATSKDKDQQIVAVYNDLKPVLESHLRLLERKPRATVGVVRISTTDMVARGQVDLDDRSYVPEDDETDNN